MSTHVACTRTKLAEAHIYRSQADAGGLDSYYFCCKTCGNCGRHWTAVGPASQEAAVHVTQMHAPKEG